MAIDATDWTIDRLTKEIAYTGDAHGGASPTYATVIQFHRWLQDLADDALATGDDELDITNVNPSSRSTDNIITLINDYYISDATSQHLYDGSIIQDNGDTIYDGIVNFGNASVQIHLIQDGSLLASSWWNQGGAGLNPDANAGISHRFMVKVREDGVDIDQRKLVGICRTLDDSNQNTFSEFKINGTSRGNNVLALNDTNDLNNESTATTISGWTNITNTEGLNLIDVNDDDTDEKYYSQWTDDNSPDREINDFYERLKWITRIGTSTGIHGFTGDEFRGITHSFPYDAEYGGIAIATNDDLAWGTLITYNNEVNGPFVVGEAIHEDSATPVWKGRVLAVDDSAPTGTLIVDVRTGTVTSGEGFTSVRGASETTADVNGTPTAVTGGGVMRVLAIDDAGATGIVYVQTYKGTAPANNAIVYDLSDHTQYVDASADSTERAISTPFCGISTGASLIGAYGLGVDITDLTDSDIMTALDGNTYSRPNLVTNTVSGLRTTATADRVIVAPWDGTSYDTNGDPALDKGQMLLATALTSSGIIAVVVKDGTETAIPSDTPSSGYIRVEDDNGFERRLHFSGWSGTTFTIDTSTGEEDFSSVNASVDNNVYVAYLDVQATSGSHSYQAAYSSARDLVALVRNGGAEDPIKQFIAEWSFASTNQTLNAIRTTDL